MSVVLNSVDCCYRLQCDNCNSTTASYTTSSVVVLHPNNSVECCYRLQCDNCNSTTASYTTSSVVVLHLTTVLSVATGCSVTTATVQQLATPLAA